MSTTRAGSRPRASPARPTRRAGSTPRSPPSWPPAPTSRREAGRVTVGAVYASWSAAQGHISAKTAATREAHGTAGSSRSGATWRWPTSRPSAVRAWVAKMVADDVGVPTIENAFGLLRQVLGAAVEDSRIPRNPCDGVKLPKRQHADRGYLSHAQVAALADAVERQAEVVRFLAYTGLRWGEMAALRVQDFDMLRRRVNVSPLGHRVRRAGVVHAEDVGAALGAVPGRPGRRAGRADGGQGPRRPGVHRSARRGAAQLQLAGTGVRARRGEVPAGRRRPSRRSLRTTCGTRRRAWPSAPAPTSRRFSGCSGTPRRR